MTRPGRILVAIVAVAVTLGGDIWLIRRPEPHSVAEFSPFSTKLGREELILTRPAPQEGPLFSHQGGKNEVVDIFFERGILSDQTRRLLRQQPWAQSKEPQVISYTTLDSPQASGAVCRTSANFEFENAKAKGIRLFQSGVPGGEQHREIELKTEGSGLAVDFQTAADDPAQPNQPGCRKLLQVGAEHITLNGIPLKITAEAGSSVRLKFMPASEAIWKGRKGLFEPFQVSNLRVQAASISPINSPQAFRKVSSTGHPSIFIDSLLIGSDQFEARLSGVGMVAIDGSLVGPTFSEWVSASSRRSIVVAFANLAVLCAAVFFVTLGRRLKIQLASDRGIRARSALDGLRVFLCHCSEDKPTVRQLKQRLEADAFQPWLDEEDIFPARLWGEEIQQALRSSHSIVVCLSRVFEYKEGFVQKELGYALDIAQEKPDGVVFLIPVRLEDCQIPHRLCSWQCIDLFVPGGYEKLKLALHERARQVGLELRNPQKAGV